MTFCRFNFNTLLIPVHLTILDMSSLIDLYTIRPAFFHQQNHIALAVVRYDVGLDKIMSTEEQVTTMQAAQLTYVRIDIDHFEYSVDFYRFFFLGGRTWKSMYLMYNQMILIWL